MNFCYYHSRRGLQECACRTDSERKRNQNFFRHKSTKSQFVSVLRRQHENRSLTFVSMVRFCCDMSQRSNNDLECLAL